MAEFRFLLAVKCHATATACHKCVCSSTTPWPISFQLCGSPSAWFHIFISSFKGTIFSLIRALSLIAQQVHDVEMILYWHTATSSRHTDISTTLFQRHVSAGRGTLTFCSRIDYTIAVVFSCLDYFPNFIASESLHCFWILLNSC